MQRTHLLRPNLVSHRCLIDEHHVLVGCLHRVTVVTCGFRRAVLCYSNNTIVYENFGFFFFFCWLHLDESMGFWLEIQPSKYSSLFWDLIWYLQMFYKLKLFFVFTHSMQDPLYGSISHLTEDIISQVLLTCAYCWPQLCFFLARVQLNSHCLSYVKYLTNHQH